MTSPTEQGREAVKRYGGFMRGLSPIEKGYPYDTIVYLAADYDALLANYQIASEAAAHAGDAIRELSAARLEVERLREALGKHGRHDSDCMHLALQPCTCGYSAALATVSNEGGQ